MMASAVRTVLPYSARSSASWILKIRHGAPPRYKNTTDCRPSVADEGKTVAEQLLMLVADVSCCAM